MIIMASGSWYPWASNSLAFQMPVLNQAELFDIILSHQLPFSDFQAKAQSSIGNKPVDLFELTTEYCIMT